VGGGGGGGGGGPPAHSLTAPKTAKTNTSHKHNFSFFTIKMLPSVNCLNSLLIFTDVSQNENKSSTARHVPTKAVLHIAYVSSLTSASYVSASQFTFASF
jgi:hypothetical protein